MIAKNINTFDVADKIMKNMYNKEAYVTRT